eukprot:CAMPEP_0196130872 /NCGR_PEP_ID=MMETSP0910-20130528/1091_1 /TAXON_ID=49265 /ORGANISM="Thalassiosira rotula, Strain GSO102" /LENGTH=1024 /DNA_ID=CAMNT_0041390255 /DNA_START=28 /DNA_END=3102 /DNA_ORIENTATION=+
MITSPNDNDNGDGSGGVHGLHPPDLSSALSTVPSTANDGVVNPHRSDDGAPLSTAACGSSDTTENDETRIELDDDVNEEPIISALQMSAALQVQGTKKRVVIDESEEILPMPDDYAAMLHDADDGGDKKSSTAAEHAQYQSSSAVFPRVPTPLTRTPRRDNDQSEQHTKPSPPQSISPPSIDEENNNSLLQSQQQQQPVPTEVTNPLDIDNHDPPYDEENPVPILEATLVVDNPLPNSVSDVPNDESRFVYVATQVKSNSNINSSSSSNTNTNYKRYVLVVLVSLLIGGMATAIAMLLVGGNSTNGAERDMQPIEQTIITTTPPSKPLQDTQESEPSSSTKTSTIQSPVPPPFIPTSNETATAPSTALVSTTEVPTEEPEQSIDSAASPAEPTSTPTPRPATFAPVIQPTSMPIVASVAPIPRPMTLAPVIRPTNSPVPAPSYGPTSSPTPRPATLAPVIRPTNSPVPAPSRGPTSSPTPRPVTSAPVIRPTNSPVPAPSHGPTSSPIPRPVTSAPVIRPTNSPVPAPSHEPTSAPTPGPATSAPVIRPTNSSIPASVTPTISPVTFAPVIQQMNGPTPAPPSYGPTLVAIRRNQTFAPVNRQQTDRPSFAPSYEPTSATTGRNQTLAPVIRPTTRPTATPFAPTPMIALSPMAQMQSSVLELANEEIDPHRSRENVAIDGNTAIVGAPANENNRGFALVYIREENGKWRQQSKLEAPDGAVNDWFGWSVGIHGDTAIVGAAGDDDNGEWSGSVYLFVRMGDAWMYQAKLLAPDGADGDWFGRRVGVYGDTAIVGAYRDNDKGERSGSVHLFVLNGDTWMHQVKLVAPDGVAGDSFGYSVGIYGDTIIIGAPWDDDKGENSGSVHLYTRIGGIWMHQHKLVAPDGAASDYFGASVGIFGNTAIVSAYGDDDDGESSGSVHVFTRSGDTWMPQDKLVAPDGAAKDWFGHTVRIFGDTVVIGARGDDDNGNKSGSAHLFVRNGVTWMHKMKLLAPKPGDEFGRSVAIYNGTVIVGSESGEVYVFSG